MPRLPNFSQQEEGGVRRRRTLVTSTRTPHALLTPPIRKFPNESAVRNKWDGTLRGPHEIGRRMRSAQWVDEVKLRN